MPKIIFTSQYMRDAPPAQLENYVKYIGTREGVEKIDESKLLLLVTVKQQQLIGQLIRDILSTKDNDGFLTAPAIEAMRSELAHDIYRQDFAQIYEHQNDARSQLKL